MSDTLWSQAGGTPKYDEDGVMIEDWRTCGTCGRSWNDAIVTDRTPVPSGRCPFESEHEDEGHDPECTGCEHDCPWKNNPLGAPFCSICDDHWEAGDDPDDETYSIVRFHFQDESVVIDTGLTLEEAQEHCQREDTHGDGWFDGYRKES